MAEEARYAGSEGGGGVHASFAFKRSPLALLKDTIGLESAMFRCSAVLALVLICGCEQGAVEGAPEPAVQASRGVTYLIGDPDPVSISWARSLYAPYSSSSSSFAYGSQVAVAGDVDGDGYDDVLVSDNYTMVTIYMGGPYGLNPEPEDAYGSSSARVNTPYRGGDVDGDGYDEVIIGDIRSSGNVYLWNGSEDGATSTSADWSFSGPSSSSACASADASGDVDGDGYDDLLIGCGGDHDVYLYSGSSTGLGTIPSWYYLSTGSVLPYLGESVAHLGDVNGDGFGDIAAGAYYATDTHTQEGVVLGWYGSSSGLSSTEDWSYYSGVAGAKLGTVAWAGDIEGDGYADLLMATNAGQDLFLVSGSSSGLSSSPSWTWTAGDTEAGNFHGLGDIDGDGYGDIAACYSSNYLYLFHGSSSGLGTTYDDSFSDLFYAKGLGTWISGPGDFNGDGYHDVLAGAPDNDTAWVFDGSADGMVTSGVWEELYSKSGEYDLGTSMTQGDFNGDGIEDLAISAGDTTQVLVFHGTGTGFPSAADTTLFAYVSDCNGCLAAMDMDGDGYDELAVGNPSSSYGSFEVYSGSASGLSSSSYSSVSNPVTGYYASSTYGSVLAWAGDLNGDGYEDLIAGDPEYSTSTSTDGGMAYVFLGSSAGVGSTADWSVGGYKSSELGLALSGAGDVDGDGYDDVLVGSKRSTSETMIIFGSSSGPGSSSAWYFTATSDLYSCYRPRAIGDVDEDGYDDIALGCLGTDNVAVFLGGSSGPGSTADFTLSGGDVGDSLGWSIEAGDLDGDGWTDLAVGAPWDETMGSEGAVHVFLGSATGFGSSSDFALFNVGDQGALGMALAIRDDDSDGAQEILAAAPGTLADAVWVVELVDEDEDGAVAFYDCDDDDDTVYPGAPEACDELDNDCDGDIDEDLPDWYPDDDGDGFGDEAATATSACEGSSGYVSNNLDCDDTDADIHPDADETCNTVDDDCDGNIDPGTSTDASTWYADSDSDGYGNPNATTTACSLPSGYSSDDTDCDDSDSTVNPAGTESCNGLDDDCDGTIDPDTSIGVSTWYLDADDDGYGDLAATDTAVACDQPEGYAATTDDCDDADASIHPGAAELCDAMDNDCDGTTDVGAVDAITWYTDADGDGYGDSTLSTSACTAPSGTVANDEDCDDTLATVSPDGTEACNGIDDDCDGDVDPSTSTDAVTWYLDDDGDGYGEASSTTLACNEPSGYADNDQDCDDTDSSVSPDGSELCNGIDDDCDGTTDPDSSSDAPTWYADDDADGYGDAADTEVSCEAPSGYVDDAQDCDDTESAVSPAATEVCNGIDDDCDGSTDPGSSADALTWYADDDGDGFGNPTSTTTACEEPSGYVDNDADCDDRTAAASPDSEEVCNDRDDDCDGEVDEQAIDPTTWYADVDGDGFGDPDSSVDACDKPEGYAFSNQDCDDTDAQVHPGVQEHCDGEDEDCNGEVDDNAEEAEVWFSDGDGDGYGDPGSGERVCEPTVTMVQDNTDCDDSRADVYPGADEVCDEVDQDCDDEVDEAAIDFITCFVDEDMDGWGTPITLEACTCEAGAAEVDGDCDDSDPNTYPGATDTWYDDVDSNCDGANDFDADGDGFALSGDCDDSDPNIGPTCPKAGCSHGGPAGWMWLPLVPMLIQLRRRRRRSAQGAGVNRLPGRNHGEPAGSSLSARQVMGHAS